MAPLLPLNAATAINPVCRPAACSGLDTSGPINNIRNCSSYSDTCYSGAKIRTCNTCDSGYTLTETTTTLTTCTGNITYYYCKADIGGDIDPIICNGTCSDCDSSTWTAAGTGYQQRTNATCNTKTCLCTKSTEYRCASGYYGTPPKLQMIGNLKGCTRCPSSGGIYGLSDVGRNSEITDCYMTNDSSDNTGDFTYTSKCYYTE